MRTGKKCAHQAAGFTYLGLIVLVALIGLATAATLQVGAVLRRGAAEQALLDVGAEFADALASYAAATPAGQPPQPPSLQELLNDPRFPYVRRHLRKVFFDPVTGQADWGIVYLTGDNGDRGMIAVHSLSAAHPIKQANFEARFADFEHKLHLSDWKFGQAQARVGQALPP